MSNTWARITGPKGDRPDPSTFIGTPAIGVLSLASGLQRYDNTWTNPRVWRTWEGLCFMEGLLRRTDSGVITVGTIIATIPVGFRPYARTLLNGVSSADNVNLFTRLDLDPDGTLTFSAAMGSSGFISTTGRWQADH